MAASVESGWFAGHRRWEDWCSAGLGVLAVLSPVFAGVDPSLAVAFSAGITGIIITMVAMMEMLELSRWEELIELVCGAWLVASPFALDYGGALRTWHVVLGAGVIALALLELWQDRDRRLAS
jgi:hypothetical protein